MAFPSNELYQDFFIGPEFSEVFVLNQFYLRDLPDPPNDLTSSFSIKIYTVWISPTTPVSKRS